MASPTTTKARALSSPDVTTKRPRQQGETPATHRADGEQRFVVVANNAEGGFDLWFFDKQENSDYIAKETFPDDGELDAEFADTVLSWLIFGVR
jgi:hypothetical protein